MSRHLLLHQIHLVQARLLVTSSLGRLGQEGKAHEELVRSPMHPRLMHHLVKSHMQRKVEREKPLRRRRAGNGTPMGWQMKTVTPRWIILHQQMAPHLEKTKQRIDSELWKQLIRSHGALRLGDDLFSRIWMTKSNPS
jgi:hypothetical protein